MKTAYIVTGAESSGNRLVAAAMVRGGCSGSASTQQLEVRDLVRHDKPLLIVHWADRIRRAVSGFRERGFDVRIVCVMRDWHCIVESQKWRGHDDESSFAKLRDYYADLFGVLSDLDFTLVNYESFRQNPRGVSHWLCDRLGLRTDNLSDPLRLNLHDVDYVYDANAKWFERGGTLYLVGYDGIGDTIYQRPVVRSACERYEHVYLRTSWPQLYWDLIEDYGLKVVASPTKLRTQALNVAAWRPVFSEPPKLGDCSSVRLAYGTNHFERGLTISESFEECLPLHGKPFRFELPIHPTWRQAAERISACWSAERFALIFPPTLRSEWYNESRNCKSEYVQYLSSRLRARGIYVVSVAFVDGDGESFVEPEVTEYDRQYHGGELNIETIAALMRMAVVTVSPVGFPLPMALATGAKAVIVFGGCNVPDLLVDKRIDSSCVRCVAPEPFCNCLQHRHDCNKEIDRRRLSEALDSVLGD